MTPHVNKGTNEKIDVVALPAKKTCLRGVHKPSTCPYVEIMKDHVYVTLHKTC